MASSRAGCKEASGRPVRPRDAASLILLRHEGRELQVLVGRRPPQARFLPGRYVFPGGAVEPGDSRARPASALNLDLVESMAVGGKEMRARSLAMAAVRETFEETGLLLTAPGDVGSVRSPQLVRHAHPGRGTGTPPSRLRGPRHHAGAEPDSIPRALLRRRRAIHDGHAGRR